MKKLISVLLIPVVIAACTSNTGNAPVVAKSAGPALTMPYTAAYSSDFSMGSDSNSLAVLKSYKAWEDGNMEAVKNSFGDSTLFQFPNGYTFKGTNDSLMKMASKQRDSLSSVALRFDAWIPVHANDKNTDWVLAWYTEIDTYKDGKVDSAYFQDDNQVKDGKIIYVDSKMRKLK